MYACVYVFVHVFAYVCVHRCMCGYICVCTCIYEYVCARVWAPDRMDSLKYIKYHIMVLVRTRHRGKAEAAVMRGLASASE